MLHLSDLPVGRDGRTRRAVRELERAGLVMVQRKPGRRLDVTILDTSGAGARTDNSPTMRAAENREPISDLLRRTILEALE
jgi:hypothetical protein